MGNGNNSDPLGGWGYTKRVLTSGDRAAPSSLHRHTRPTLFSGFKCSSRCGGALLRRACASALRRRSERRCFVAPVQAAVHERRACLPCLARQVVNNELESTSMQVVQDMPRYAAAAPPNRPAATPASPLRRPRARIRALVVHETTWPAPCAARSALPGAATESSKAWMLSSKKLATSRRRWAWSNAISKRSLLPLWPYAFCKRLAEAAHGLPTVPGCPRCARGRRRQ